MSLSVFCSPLCSALFSVAVQFQHISVLFVSISAVLCPFFPNLAYTILKVALSSDMLKLMLNLSDKYGNPHFHKD